MKKKPEVRSQKLEKHTTAALQEELLKRAIAKTEAALLANDTAVNALLDDVRARLHALNTERATLTIKLSAQNRELCLALMHRRATKGKRS